MKLTYFANEPMFVKKDAFAMITMPKFTSHNLLLFTESLHILWNSFLKDFTDGAVVS